MYVPTLTIFIMLICFFTAQTIINNRLDNRLCKLEKTLDDLKRELEEMKKQTEPQS